ncbi:DUF2970 domain-containing protein [Ralstonia insidiosa]|jgi:hypothetical protein|uniref:DUF2970 domain-containing protein n=2 Tax=Pseudomonadota TaxID=1224 RepID=A0A191ZT04_9RALS|nr:MULTISPECIES: DUF2970 domain-containing protein [Ralstonia]KMW46340.1 membrane protein [Ralstonia sp. MD27]MBX3771967.1 DUF2970 domain-containing protein [Ralstonia pickettii]NPA00995.1 DUF2970 domain-containing protein [Betaproteobacteria bacterium]ANH74433.1 hypothetical protein ACS15_0329 [Ralstonia insidiosa]ANJ71229.1 hypothetical protein A9Y76_01465 [Ralstonia insidiosa]
MDDLKEATKRRASFAQTMKAVFWSFFGVRKGRDHDRDMAQLNPVHVIIAGLLATALFIFVLLMIVRAVVGSQ